MWLALCVGSRDAHPLSWHRRFEGASRPMVICSLGAKSVGHTWAMDGPQMGHEEKRPSHGGPFLCLVAGAGFEPTTFGL